MAESRKITFSRIAELTNLHSPSGSEDEIDQHLMKIFEAGRLNAERDPAGNIVLRFPGSGHGCLAITAHKDEIGGIVTAVEPEGRLRVKKLGGAYPWVYGEGVVDLLGEHETISGILSFGSRHVSPQSPQHAFKATAPIQWKDAWVETKRTSDDLDRLGIRPGTRMVVAKQRKTPTQIGHYIAGYGLDNKASLAVLVELAGRIEDPFHDIVLVATAKEEPGAVGALYFSQRNQIDAMVALEIAPIAPEYAIAEGASPVLFAEDAHGLYDEALNNTLRRFAGQQGIETQTGVFNGFGSDASICVKNGHVPRAACLGFPTQNSHGYEIAHLDAFDNMLAILVEACRTRLW